MKHYGDITKLSGYELPPVDVITGGSSYKVYIYEFPNNKVYVGMTKNTLEKRRDMGYQHNKPLQCAIRKYGWRGIKHDVIAENLTKEEAEKLEKEIIKKYESTNPLKGYNVSYGGKETYKGLCHTKEYKKHMSNLYKGRSFSVETLDRMREAHKKERKPVRCFSLDGTLIKCFESLHEAAKAVNGYPTNISRACKKETKTYKGYVWSFGN